MPAQSKRLSSFFLSTVFACLPLLIGFAPSAYAQFPPLPTGLSPNDGAQVAATTQVVLSWTAVPGASSYNVRANNWSNSVIRDPQNNCPNSPHYLCVNGVITNSIPMPVDPGSSYGFFLHACNAAGCGDVAAANFTVLTAAPPAQTVPPAPTGLSPANTTLAAGTASVTLTWNPVAGATWYAVRANDATDPNLRAPGNNCGAVPHYLCVNSGNNANSLAVPVTAGHSYYWWVHACNQFGCSDPASSTFSVAAAPPPPATNSVDLRSFFPVTTNTYRSATGYASAIYNFFLANQVAADPFWGLYTQLFDLRKSAGKLLIWQKIYASNPIDFPENLNCTATYGHLFLGGGNDKSVVEIGDWLNNNGQVSSSGGVCPSNYRAFGYQNTGSFALPATGINWSGIDGLDPSSSALQIARVFGQNPPSTSYIDSGFTEYSSPILVEVLSTWSPLYGRNPSNGNWGTPGKAYSNVVRMILYHGTSDGTVSTACTGTDPNNPYSVLYLHKPNYRSYAIELFLDQQHGILQETLLYDESGYFGYPPCSPSFPALSLNTNLASAMQNWRKYID